MAIRMTMLCGAEAGKRTDVASRRLNADASHECRNAVTPTARRTLDQL
jgi:hypothetical protein